MRAALIAWPLQGDSLECTQPGTQLYGFKVLGDAGNGRDSLMIKAVQHVANLNTRAGELVIHGVDLSCPATLSTARLRRLRGDCAHRADHMANAAPRTACSLTRDCLQCVVLR
ncbi:hypothetical protein EIQ03_02800 [Xanthomonas campestris pv. raphani]